MNIQRIVGSRLAIATSLLLVAAQAHAITGPEPENLATVGPMGGIIFGVIFVGFCVGVVWMMAKQKDQSKDTDEKKS
jgi:H+/gluconate symporter-like permease